MKNIEFVLAIIWIVLAAGFYQLYQFQYFADNPGYTSVGFARTICAQHAYNDNSKCNVDSNGNERSVIISNEKYYCYGELPCHASKTPNPQASIFEQPWLLLILAAVLIFSLIYLYKKQKDFFEQIIESAKLAILWVFLSIVYFILLILSEPFLSNLLKILASVVPYIIFIIPLTLSAITTYFFKTKYKGNRNLIYLIAIIGVAILVALLIFWNGQTGS